MSKTAPDLAQYYGTHLMPEKPKPEFDYYWSWLTEIMYVITDVSVYALDLPYRDLKDIIKYNPHVPEFPFGPGLLQLNIPDMLKMRKFPQYRCQALFDHVLANRSRWRWQEEMTFRNAKHRLSARISVHGAVADMGKWLEDQEQKFDIPEGYYRDLDGDLVPKVVVVDGKAVPWQKARDTRARNRKQMYVAGIDPVAADREDEDPWAYFDAIARFRAKSERTRSRLRQWWRGPADPVDKMRRTLKLLIWLQVGLCMYWLVRTIQLLTT